jgi:hypothetical protein
MKLSIFAVSVALSIGVAGAASAQGQGGGDHAAFAQACSADLQTYCASAQSRDDRHACIQANKDKFSDSCKSFIASRHQHGQMQGPGGGGQ